MNLLPSRYGVVILLDGLLQFEGVKIVFLNVPLEYVDEYYLNGETGPLAWLENLQDLIDVVYDACCEDLSLVEDLGKSDFGEALIKTCLLFFSYHESKTFQELECRGNFHREIELDLA